ncbi:hypothetical protein L6R53_18215 [Myxococcota bacterium]|nr:hypothetical protein [Myxococcota bacterium]
MHLSLALLLFACPLDLSPKPSGTADFGECQGTPGSSSRVPASTEGEPTEEEPEVLFDAADGVLVLDYLAMDANCCPSPRVDVETAAGSVSVDLVDVAFDDPCDCMCTTDFQVEVVDLEPGTWTVSALFNGALVATEVVDL